MSGRVADALAPLDAAGANTPVALMTCDASPLILQPISSLIQLCRYTDAAQQPLGPSVPVSCIVERTLGDRRLGSHVLAGLELLLPLIVNDGALDVQAVARAFPEGRPRCGICSMLVCARRARVYTMSGLCVTCHTGMGMCL